MGHMSILLQGNKKIWQKNTVMQMIRKLVLFFSHILYLIVEIRLNQGIIE